MLAAYFLGSEQGEQSLDDYIPVLTGQTHLLPCFCRRQHGFYTVAAHYSSVSAAISPPYVWLWRPHLRMAGMAQSDRTNAEPFRDLYKTVQHALATFMQVCSAPITISLSFEVIHVTEAWPRWWYGPKFLGSLLHPVRHNSGARAQALFVRVWEPAFQMRWSTEVAPKKNSYQWVYFWWIKHPMEKYYVKMTANPRNQSWTGSWSGLEHAPSLWATPFREVHKTVQHALATLRLLFKQGPQAFSTYTVIVFGLDLFQ